MIGVLFYLFSRRDQGERRVDLERGRATDLVYPSKVR